MQERLRRTETLVGKGLAADEDVISAEHAQALLDELEEYDEARKFLREAVAANAINRR